VDPPKEPTPGPSKLNPVLNQPSFALLSKIRQQGFGAEDLAQAAAFKQNLEERERQAESQQNKSRSQYASGKVYETD
jgi:hypothetical protein